MATSGEDERGVANGDFLCRTPDVTPLVTLDESKKLYLLELFCGPTFAFKDVALQFLGNLFEYFLVRMNKVDNALLLRWDIEREADLEYRAKLVMTAPSYALLVPRAETLALQLSMA